MVLLLLSDAALPSQMMSHFTASCDTHTLAFLLASLLTHHGLTYECVSAGPLTRWSAVWMATGKLRRRYAMASDLHVFISCRQCQVIKYIMWQLLNLFCIGKSQVCLLCKQFLGTMYALTSRTGVSHFVKQSFDDTSDCRSRELPS